MMCPPKTNPDKKLEFWQTREEGEVYHEAKEIFGRADCRGVEAGGVGDSGSGYYLADRYFRTDILPLEEAVCRSI